MAKRIRGHEMNLDRDGGPVFPVDVVHDQLNSDLIFGQQTSHASGFQLGLSLRDYFAAHAPPVPQFIQDDFVAMLRQDQMDDLTLSWNDGILHRMATLEKRWRDRYADAMLSGRITAPPHPRPRRRHERAHPRAVAYGLRRGRRLPAEAQRQI